MVMILWCRCVDDEDNGNAVVKTGNDGIVSKKRKRSQNGVHEIDVSGRKDEETGAKQTKVCPKKCHIMTSRKKWLEEEI